MDDTLLDKLAIRELLENWALWRDAGDWERFRTVWHADGKMYATWTQCSAEEFIEASRKGFESGVSILHFLGGQTIDVAGMRAISQMKMTISQRAEVHGVACDVLCTGRFYDFLEKRSDDKRSDDKRDAHWGVVLRRVIYEKDRMDPVDPAAKLELEQKKLATFPVGYRHLAYLQDSIGFRVKRNMPGLTGPEVETLYRCGRDWLDGKSIDAAYHET
jgi:hypothetical protein